MNEVRVAGVNLLNVLVEHLAVQHALGGMRVDALVRRPPEAIMKMNENYPVEETDKEEGQPEVAT